MQPRRAALDSASHAALRAILAVTPDAHVVQGPALLEAGSPTVPAVLAAADLVEGGALRATVVGEGEIGFAAFLDGTQRTHVPAWQEGIPYVFGTVAAAIRLRHERRLSTWMGRLPVVQRAFYLPLRWMPRAAVPNGFPIVDTTDDEHAPSRHPASLIERALVRVQRDRERVEQELAAAWIAEENGVLCADGPLAGSAAVRGSRKVIGVVKTHRTLYADGEFLSLVLGLRCGERSPVFVISAGSRASVASWYLRLRDASAHDSLWGLARVECALESNAGERANVVSRWLLAERAPLALPDFRWDTMSYGIRDCESFLRAIS